MKNYNGSAEINHSPNWSYITDHPYRILIIGGLGSGKTTVICCDFNKKSAARC